MNGNNAASLKAEFPDGYRVQLQSHKIFVPYVAKVFLITQLVTSPGYTATTTMKHGTIISMIALLCFCSFQSNGQDRVLIDSLNIQLKGAEEDEAKADLLIDLAWAMVDSDCHIALKNSEQALELSENLSYQSGVADAYFIIGQININYLLHYDKGLSHLTKSLELVKGTGRWQREMSTLSQIAYVHYRQANFEKAVTYYEKATIVARENGDLRNLSELYSYIAEIYEKENKLAEALEEYEKIIELETARNFEGSEPGALIGIAHYYELKKQPDEAESFYEDALEIFKATDNKRWAAYTYYLLAKLRLKNGDHDDALNYGHEGLSLASAFKLTKEIADNHKILSDIYDSIGDYQNAYKHHMALSVIDDSVFNIERAREIAFIQSTYESTIRENDLARLEQEKALQSCGVKREQSYKLWPWSSSVATCISWIASVQTISSEAQGE